MQIQSSAIAVPPGAGGRFSADDGGRLYESNVFSSYLPADDELLLSNPLLDVKPPEPHVEPVVDKPSDAKRPLETEDKPDSAKASDGVAEPEPKRLKVEDQPESKPEAE